MRIALIHPQIREWAAPNIPPLGLLHLSSVLRLNGHEVKIIDVNAHRWSKGEVEKQVAEADFDVYGVGGLATTYSYVVWLTKLIRQYHPENPCIWGGPLTLVNPNILLKHVDAVVIGEGEEAILDVVKDIDAASLKKIYRKDPVRDLDTLPPPDYANLDTLQIYLKAAVGAHNPRKWQDGKPIRDVKILPILSGRGCPFNCNFCLSHYLGSGYRLRSVSAIVKEARALIDCYGVEYLHFCDELTISSEVRCLELCRELSKLDVTWGCPVRIDLLSYKQMQEMEDGGCIHIGTGIESFSPRVLSAMNKHLDVKNAKANLKLAKQMGFDVQYTLILGYPLGETKETIAETVEGVKDVGFPPEQVFFPTPYPGTELYRYACSAGFITNEEEYLVELSGHEQRDIIFNFTSLSESELLNAKEEILHGGRN